MTQRMLGKKLLAECRNPSETQLKQNSVRGLERGWISFCLPTLGGGGVHCAMGKFYGVIFGGCAIATPCPIPPKSDPLPPPWVKNTPHPCQPRAPTTPGRGANFLENKPGSDGPPRKMHQKPQIPTRLLQCRQYR